MDFKPSFKSVLKGARHGAFKGGGLIAVLTMFSFLVLPVAAISMFSKGPGGFGQDNLMMVLILGTFLFFFVEFITLFIGLITLGAMCVWLSYFTYTQSRVLWTAAVASAVFVFNFLVLMAAVDPVVYDRSPLKSLYNVMVVMNLFVVCITVCGSTFAFWHFWGKTYELEAEKISS